MHAERQVLEDDLHILAVLLLDLLEGRTDPRTEWSLKVGVLDDLHLGGIRPFCR
jgi:hypothetical protein